MRSLEDARESWRLLQQYRDLRQLKDAIRVDSNASIATEGLRSAIWKAFLLFDNVEVADWQRTLAASRSAYNSMRTHFFRYIANPDEVADLDPLGQDAESSPWSQMQKDEELRAEILQDVERIGIPTVEYSQQPERQRILLDILFIFCKLNPDVGYRQGMHEIAAPILFVVENDAVDIGGISKTLGEDSVIKTVFDAEHVEHDTFALFSQVMQNAKSFYLSEGPVSIASRSRHIFNDLLPQVDPDLVKHLEGMDIVPQVFLIRWIRLLFGREFDFDAVLTIWDLVFAEDSSLELVDHICLAMLLRIRWHLLDADYNNALSLLLRYPELDKDFPAQTFALDAMYLKTHMTSEGGSYLVLKYTGRPPTTTGGRPATPPALQRNITTFAIRHATHSERKTRLSPTQTPRQTNNIEAMLQNTAKNLYARGEKLGIGKAVRTAVDEVHKKAQEIREAQTSSPPSWRRSGNVRLLDHVKEIELRNKKLATLLAGAVDELWTYQRLVSEQEVADSQTQQTETIEKLSTAIAKVQFVQVYLDEPTLSLDDADTTPEHPSRDGGTPTQNVTKSAAEENETQDKPLPSQISQPKVAAANKLADPATFEGFDEPTNSSTTGAKSATGIDRKSTSSPVAPPTATEESISSLKAPRPSLEQSSFSFMLSKSDSADDTARPPSRNRAADPLFGGHRRNYSGQGKTTFSTTTDPLDGREEDQDEFDINSLRRAKGAKK